MHSFEIRKNNTQQLAAAKSGISKRSARRVENSVTLPLTEISTQLALAPRSPCRSLER